MDVSEEWSLEGFHNASTKKMNNKNKADQTKMTPRCLRAGGEGKGEVSPRYPVKIIRTTYYVRLPLIGFPQACAAKRINLRLVCTS